MIEYTTSPNRTLTAARLALFSEAGRDPAIRAAISGGHTLMESWAVTVLTGLGAPDPVDGARALMSCCEGFVLHRIARGDTSDPRPALELVVRGVLPEGFA